MKTQANKTLHFKKEAIIELNDASLSTINGGTNGIEILATSQVGERSISRILMVDF